MDRIINRMSFNVVYFQHGIFDSSWSWVIHGVGESYAFLASDNGYDVFLGNYRGLFPRKVSAAREKLQNEGKASYWDYSIDHIAKYDIKAFMQTIFRTKFKEFQQFYPQECEGLSQEEIEQLVRKKIKITYIGHSLGGMLLPMYLVLAGRNQEDHYLTKAILLSPAGTHFHANWFIKAFGLVCCNFMPWFTDGVGMPEIVMKIGLKLIQDLKTLPASNDFITYLMSQGIGGPAYGKTTYLLKSSKLMKSLLKFGWSNKMAAHMYKVYLDQKFTSFDNGPEENQKILGQPTCLDYLSEFNKIDIPLHYFVSTDDHLCRPDDVMVQYLALRKANPSLAFVRVFEGYNHIDITYLNHHEMMKIVIQTLKSK